MQKKTALYEEHVALGAKMVEFGGWQMPIQYTGIMDEHLACRKAAGLFDVSHMGEIRVEGPGAPDFLDYLVTNWVSRMELHQAQYNVMCNSGGGIVDDLVIYRRGPQRFLLVVNASNTAKDFDHIQAMLAAYTGNKTEIKLENASRKFSQIAIQGPKAEKILQKLTPEPLSDLRKYWFTEGDVCEEIHTIIARTGYTGEDGFELYVPWGDGPQVWRALLEVGQPEGLKPCGLGARDTLRMEMKYPLYGHELNDETSPLEAGLGWVTKLEKNDFVGRVVILKGQAGGLKRRLVGIRLLDRGVLRQGYGIFDSEGRAQVGELTSGTQSPSLGYSIGIGYVTPSCGEIGTHLTVDIRGKKLVAEVVKTPFFKPGVQPQ